MSIMNIVTISNIPTGISFPIKNRHCRVELAILMVVVIGLMIIYHGCCDNDYHGCCDNYYRGCCYHHGDDHRRADNNGDDRSYENYGSYSDVGDYGSICMKHL